MEEVDDGADVGGNPRQQHTHADGATERGGVEEEFAQPRREFPFVPDMPGPGMLPAGFGAEEGGGLVAGGIASAMGAGRGQSADGSCPHRND